MQNYEHAYETHAYLPIYFAVTLSMYTLIPTVYRALLKSAVSGTDHRIHITKKTTKKSPESGIANTIILTCDVAPELGTYRRSLSSVRL